MDILIDQGKFNKRLLDYLRISIAIINNKDIT